MNVSIIPHSNADDELLMNEMIHSVQDYLPASLGISWDLLRLDEIHPVISGNKAFKLGPYLELALRQNAPGLVGFGGGWSNHLHALAFAARENGLRAMAIIRGEARPEQNPMLDDCIEWGMELHFLSRLQYRHLSGAQNRGSLLAEPLSGLEAPAALIQAIENGWTVIPEGGYGLPGVEGAARIGALIPAERYSHILCAVGTGTMVTGLALARQRWVVGGPGKMPAASPEIIGLPVLKNQGLEADIDRLLSAFPEVAPPLLLHRFHGGGYAKATPELLTFMSDFYHATGVPTDLVYTSKLMVGIRQLALEGYFPQGSRLLAIHSGGLQGNRSLKKGILPY